MILPWPELKLPTYKTGKHGPWVLSDTTGSMPGYFTPDVEPRTVPALRRKEHGKEIVWMSLTQMEMESHMPHIAAAHGHTVVMGLGMGMYLYNILQKPEVTKVTVVEKDRRVLQLLRHITNLDEWPGIEKVKFVICDAREFFTLEPVDFLYADFWKRMADRNAKEWTTQVVGNINPHHFGYWTQEMDFIHYMASLKIGIEYANVECFNEFAESVAGKHGPRMVGQDDSQYVLLCCIATVIQTIVSFAVKKDDKFGAHMLNLRLAELIGKYDDLQVQPDAAMT